MSKAAATSGEIAVSGSDSVVIRCGARIVKGHLEWPRWSAADGEAPSADGQACDVFRVRNLETNVMEEIPAGEISAVFFVGDFTGDPERCDLRFHAQEQVLPGIWIQVKFFNGEVIEGVVENSIRYLADPGFFLRPTDPGSNNKLVYVMKSAIVEHHVLGVTR